MNARQGTQIRILRPGDESLLESFLLPRIESSMFLVANMRTAGLADTGRRYEGTYAAAFEAGCIRGVVAHFWNGNLVFQAPAYRDQLWRRAAAASGRPIRGLIGPNEQVASVKEALGIEGAQAQLDEREMLYRLDLDDLIEPDNLRLGQVWGRLIEPPDVDLLAEWLVAYSIEALGERDSQQLRDACRASVLRSLEGRSTWLLELEGQAVACSSFNATIAEAVQVGGVWTPPHLRRRGFGRAAVAASLLHARRQGVRTAILFTGQGNIAGQRAYEALGFRAVGDYRLVLLPLLPGGQPERP